MCVEGFDSFVYGSWLLLILQICGPVGGLG